MEESSSARLGEEEAPQAALYKQSQKEHVASSVRNYKQQLAAQHRQHATGVSYLTDVPGRAEPVPAAQGSTHFANFADAHLPPGGSSHAPSHTGRGPNPFTSGAEDRVRPCYRPAGPTCFVAHAPTATQQELQACSDRACFNDLLACAGVVTGDV